MDLNALLKNLEKILRRLISEDIDLVLELAEDLSRIKADFGQIEQVVANLAVNSRDAMSQGGTLTIETANVELNDTYAQSRLGVVPGRYVMIAVADTGCGMDKELCLLFEKKQSGLKQRIDKGRCGLSNDNQKRHHQKNQDDGDDPPFLVMHGESKKILQEIEKVFQENH